jgi:hypothetical protein
MSTTSALHSGGITLRQAAVITGLAYVLDPVAYAELSLYPRVVIPNNVGQTVHNIEGMGGLFAAAILCYLINFILDFIAAWALYFLLKPVNNALSLLMAGLRVLYTVLGLYGVLQLALAYRLVHGPYYSTAFGVSQLQAQVQVLIDSFRYGWTFSLVIFGIHLVLLGYLIYRSGYIPKLLGILLAFLGFGWMATELRPYLYPAANLDWFFTVGFAELLFPLWLLIMGWRIRDPDLNRSSTV